MHLRREWFQKRMPAHKLKFFVPLASKAANDLLTRPERKPHDIAVSIAGFFQMYQDAKVSRRDEAAHRKLDAAIYEADFHSEPIPERDSERMRRGLYRRLGFNPPEKPEEEEGDEKSNPEALARDKKNVEGSLKFLKLHQPHFDNTTYSRLEDALKRGLEQINERIESKK